MAYHRKHTTRALTLAFLVAFLLCGAQGLIAGEAREIQPGAKSPTESLKCFQVPSPFEVKLVASEPLIESPVDFEWGADGRLWVVEMRDYPNVKASGAICYLDDTNGDGIYDTTTTFLDDLHSPNGLYPWRDGVIFSAAEGIFYAAATNGSKKANLLKTIISGFFPGNPQHRLNGFDY